MRWRTDIILARDYDFGERGDVDMFPEHFLWGGAVSANQCEGAIVTGKQIGRAHV